MSGDISKVVATACWLIYSLLVLLDSLSLFFFWSLRLILKVVH